MSSPESLPSSSFPSLNCTGLTTDPYLCSTPLLSESSESGNSTLSPSRSSSATRRPRTSWVFNHMPAEDPETIYLNKYMKIEWRCKYCSLSYATNGGNLVIKKHLLVKHGKTESLRSPLERILQQSVSSQLNMLSNSLRTRLLSAVSLIPVVVLVSQFPVATWRSYMSSLLQLATCHFDLLNAPSLGTSLITSITTLIRGSLSPTLPLRTGYYANLVL